MDRLDDLSKEEVQDGVMDLINDGRIETAALIVQSPPAFEFIFGGARGGRSCPLMALAEKDYADGTEAATARKLWSELAYLGAGKVISVTKVEGGYMRTVSCMSGCVMPPLFFVRNCCFRVQLTPLTSSPLSLTRRWTTGCSRRRRWRRSAAAS